MFLFCSSGDDPLSSQTCRPLWGALVRLHLPLWQSASPILRPGDPAGSDPSRDPLATQRLECGFPWRQHKRVIAQNDRELARRRDNGTGIDAGNTSVTLMRNIGGAKFAR